MMLDGDSELAEFATALQDSVFSASPVARLDWFYQRSPFWDDRLNLYPVGREER